MIAVAISSLGGIDEHSLSFVVAYISLKKDMWENTLDLSHTIYILFAME